ncbi:DUF6691 family protein [Altererythrobacter sp.]|uniref:DUF6691 family protein n=1 Tax=Altererythrobacter sp. TaxID=1872480 RepID=UPI001B125352|nr:DUF6691 family protein [Altererythrobacter sp.]MBO6609729.1 YeeE/YedE family protein [Altererythrobacter sp.]MBO6641121.1 YeeE/YedE family protein [Altererythrobacter sp.]MBO6708181.1 YeeE/YedE family protein [Altererythrobacter sp.]
MRQLALSLLSGSLFGAGLAISGMMDPSRVRGFLDITGSWDPTLAFVMGGATVVMAIAWLVQRRMQRPLTETEFALPGTQLIDRRLISGAVLFGVGWGLAGLCPGPAIASLAVNPLPAAIFVGAMIGGMSLFKIVDRPAV